ncbi:hypothetical protein JCM11251_000177 [Rhodosporidiobolus azoricus]
MHRNQLGSYSRSGALSTEHYKLVQAVEAAQTVEAVNGALLSCLSGIKRSWEKRAPSPSKAVHDLILVLYCRSQRLIGSAHAEDGAELFRAEWSLPIAVMLAGGGGGGEKEKAMGYRACGELFTLAPHSLKLLLINTIRSDLHAEPNSPQAEGRQRLALRAIANPVLASPELLPAVRERVLDLLNTAHSPNSSRRLALEALLALVRVAQSSASLDDPSTLLQQARQSVLSLSLPPPPSTSSSSSSGRRHRFSEHAYAPSLTLLCALASSTSSSSPLHPILPEKGDRVRLAVKIVRQVLDLSPPDGQAEPSTESWALARVLHVLEDSLRDAQEDMLSRDVQDEVQGMVWQAIERALTVEGELANAIILSALRILAHLSASPVSSPTLFPLFSRLHSSLLRPSCPSVLVFALKSLALLPPSTWATPGSSADEGEFMGKGKGMGQSLPRNAVPHSEEWGELAFRAILSGLDHPDPSIRKATLALLVQVDGGLVKLHYQRLLQSLNVGSTARGGASTASISSMGSSTTGTRRTRARVIPLLLEVLPYLGASSSVSTLAVTSSLPSPSALLALLAKPELSLSSTDVLPEVVLPVLNAFRYASEEEKREFAEGLCRGAQERKSWMQGLTVMSGLLVAGTVHVLANDHGHVGQKVMQDLAAWLANVDGSVSPDVLSLLQEPFLFAFLRLLTLFPALDSSTLSTLNVHLSTAASSSSPTTIPLFPLAVGLTAPDGSGATSVEALRSLAHETREKSLAEFGEALLAAVEAADEANSSSDQTPLAGSVQAHDLGIASAISSSTSRLNYPPPPPPTSQPLRYSAYPSSSSAATAPFSPSNPFTSLPSSSSPPSASTSAAARARERADLLREREDRGGKGAGADRGVESLMGAGELALRAEGMVLDDGLEEDEEEGGRGESLDQEKGENALGLVGAEAAVENRDEERKGRSRETSGTSSGDGGGSAEPPTDLLLSLAPDDDPFESDSGH